MALRHGVPTVALYGIAHLLVDACCAAATFRTAAVASVRPDTFLALLLLYHVVAFGLQAPLGLVVDAVRMPRAAAVVGGLLTIVALAMPSMPITTIVVVAIGNAIFHVAGGAICLRLAPHRAALPGVFVAPGSVGLLSGCVLGQLYPGGVAPLALLTAAVCVAMAIWPVVSSERRLADDCPRPRQSASPGEIVLGLILLSVAVRSLLGFVVTFPWETRPGTLIALIAATCLGKALGGFAADRWGWRRVGVGAMLLSLPLLALSSTVPEAAIPGLFLVNLTMPIGLIVVAECLPGRAGFAFGLTCLVLLLGMMPPMLGVPVGGVWALLAVAVSAASLYRGLGRPRWRPIIGKRTLFSDNPIVSQVKT
jgi:FSR family fosmidomycin resistance protein-like MFS transporter